MKTTSQIPVNRPRPNALPSTSRRTLIGRAVAVVIAGFFVDERPVHGGFYHLAPNSAALLQPLIDYHRIKAADQLDRIESNRRTAAALLIGGIKEFCAASKFAYLACTRTLELGDFVPTDVQHASNYFAGCKDSFRWARERLWDAEWHKRMSKYHAHAAEYYSGLLAAGVGVLPLLPADLVAERRAAEAEYLRFHGIKKTLPPEPPPHLVPARRGDDVTASSNNTPPDSD